MLNNLDNLVAEVEPVIKYAGKILLKYFRNNNFKSNIKDKKYTTIADIESEEYLKIALIKILPNSSILAEESGKSGLLDSDYCWVIDPLDGTKNFVNDIAYFCISIGLTYKNEPIAGFIYEPICDELFYAIKNSGAFLNNKPIKVSSKNSINNCIIACSFSSLKLLYNKSFSLRLIGASALDLANVSAGRFDGVVFGKKKWWDVCAGLIILNEAGANITQANKQKVDINFNNLIAAGPQIHDNLIDLINF